MLKFPMTLDQELAAEAEAYRSELAACRAQLQAAQAGRDRWNLVVKRGESRENPPLSSMISHENRLLLSLIYIHL